MSVLEFLRGLNGSDTISVYCLVRGRPSVNGTSDHC